jgi:DNA (cytosine-5)-methyltransferase 1
MVFRLPEFDKTDNKWTTKKIFSDLPELKPGEGSIVGKYSGPVNSYLSSAEIRNGISTITHHITRPHNTNDLAIYKIAIEKFHEGKRLKYTDLPEKLRTQKNTTSFLDRFKVVSDKGFSHTVVAHIAKDGHYYIHPDIEQCRSISVREAARIQSFPDDFYFEGSRTSAFTQIGNAVPPLMAQVIAKAISRLLILP